MTPEIQDLQNRIKILEDIVLSLKGMELNVITSKDKINSRGKGIKLTSPKNPTGCEIRTGNAADNASIVAEIGANIPNGSLYLSSASLQPFFVKYNGTWILVTLP